ncbi:solute carrier family 15 member 4-like [Halichondria panicea]|uniref:solute carrier family 15 member 4-like n=1 Tax=Halichondria panicea TaxID=6063 RepID=UPI00312B731E
MSCKYGVRKFYSKGAYLVIAWTLLVSATAIASYSLIESVSTDYPIWLGAIPLSLFLLLTFWLGLLANYKLQDYTIIRIGIISLFFVAMVSSIYVLILGSGLEHRFEKYRLLNEIVYCIVGCVFLVAMTCFVCTLQLGLDQMPDASSSSITSFIAWFVFSTSAGRWIGEFLEFVLKGNCFGLVEVTITSIQLYSLCAALFASLILVLDLLFAKSWLIIEPNPPKSFTLIYCVLKFAAKHKAPLNRSALTYWEEDVPSRMDLGKSRYGGPFTTEQVEDVKSILRLLAMSPPLWLISFALAFNPTFHDAALQHRHIKFHNFTNCTSDMLFSFTYSGNLWSMIGILVNEFFIYPLFKDRLPSILKRIGVASFFSLVLSIGFIILESFQVMEMVETVISFVSNGLLSTLFLCAILELVCAQAPYNMRRLFAVYMLINYGTASIAGIYGSGAIHPKNNAMVLILFGIKAAISLLGFILYCLLARWYKRRVRDEDYHVQTVVEEVYDRYLTPRNLD